MRRVVTKHKIHPTKIKERKAQLHSHQNIIISLSFSLPGCVCVCLPTSLTYRAVTKLNALRYTKMISSDTHAKRDETTCALTTPTMLTHGDSTQGEGRTDTIYTIIHISIYVCVCVHFSAHFTVATFSSFLFVVSILPSTCMRTICRGLLLPSQGLPAFLSPRYVMRRASAIVPCIRICTSTHQGTDDFGMSPE